MSIDLSTLGAMRGGLRERRTGVWEVRLEAGRDPVTGRRRQTSRTIHGTKRDAQRALNALVAQADKGHHAGTSTSFRELADRWLAQAERDLSPTTVRRYRNLLTKRVLPAIGDRPIDRIPASDLDTFYLALSSGGAWRPGREGHQDPRRTTHRIRPFDARRPAISAQSIRDRRLGGRDGDR